MKLRSIYTIISMIMLMCIGASAQTTFYWKANDGASWNTVGNWFLDEACEMPAGSYPSKNNHKVVILEGAKCTQDIGDITIGTLEVRGLLVTKNKITTPTPSGNVIVTATGTLDNGYAFKVGGDFDVDGTLKIGVNYTVDGNMYFDGTISSCQNAITVNKQLIVTTKATIATTNTKGGSHFVCNGGFVVKSGATLDMTAGGGKFKMNSDVTFEEGSLIELKSVNVELYMKKDKTVNMNGTAKYQEARSIFVGSYDNINKNDTGIKINLGENCSFISENGSSNLFAFPDMIDWENENVYRHFTFTQGGQRMKLYLRARPEGERTFYLWPSNDNNVKSASVTTSNAWSLVDGHCVFINLPTAIEDSYTSTDTKKRNHYYPGIKNSAYNSVVDNAVVGSGLTFYLDCELRCLGSLVVDGKFERRNGANPVCANTVTLLTENSVKNAENVISSESKVYVKTRPQNTNKFYSDKSDEWSTADMWTYKPGKHWYLLDEVDDKIVTHAPSTADEEFVIANGDAVTLESDKTVKAGNVAEGSLTIACGHTLTAVNGVSVEADGILNVGKDACTDATLDGTVNLCGTIKGSGIVTGDIIPQDGCDAHNELVRESWSDFKDSEGYVTFWSVSSGDWNDYRNWSIVAPDAKDAEGNTIFPKSVSDIYPGKKDQNDKVFIQAGHEIVATNLDLPAVYDLSIDATSSLDLDGTTMSIANDLQINGTLKGSGTATLTAIGHFQKDADATLTADILVTTRPTDPVTFYSRKIGETSSWTDSNLWSIVDGQNVFLYLDNEFYYPCKTSGNVDNVVISANSSVAIDADYSLYSLDVRENGSVTIAEDRTITMVNNGAITVNGTMTISDQKRLTMEGSGHFAPSTGLVQTTSGTSTIRCNWDFLKEALTYSGGKNTFFNGDNDALAKYTSDNGGTIELTSRPSEFSFAAYKTANWDEDAVWSVAAGKRIFLYLNDNFDKEIYPGENGDGQTDSFVIPAGITITHNLKLNAFQFAEIDGTLYLKDQTLYPKNGADFDVVDGNKVIIFIKTLRGSGYINEEYDYSAKINDKTSFINSYGIFIIRKLAGGFTKFYAKAEGDWKTSSIWTDEKSQSYTNRYPGSANTQGDMAVIQSTVTNSTDDIALSELTIESNGTLNNSRSIRLVTNDKNFVIDGKYHVTGTSLMSFVGDGQSLEVNGEIEFDAGTIWTVVGNKDVKFYETKCDVHQDYEEACDKCKKYANSKFTGKGAIRISYDNIIHGTPHTTFQSILDANPKLDAFLAQGGVMEMTARPNKGKPMIFYLQADGDWNANKQMWSIGDDEHSNRVETEEYKNYHVYVYVADKQRYYYPGINADNTDYVVICNGKTVNYNIAPDVTAMSVYGTLNVNTSQTMNVIGSSHAFNIGANGTVNIEEGQTLTLTNGINMNFAAPEGEHKQLTGTGTLICYSSAVYTVNEEGVAEMKPAVKSFVEEGGTLILMDRPASELTFYSVPTTNIAWDNVSTPHWTLVEGHRAFVLRALYTKNREYYYPSSNNVDNVVLTEGTIMTNTQNLTLNNFEVRDDAEIILTYDRTIKINGKLKLNDTGKLSAKEGLTRAFYRVESYNNLEFAGRSDDLIKLNQHRSGVYDNQETHLFESNIGKHLSKYASLWICQHPEGSINFYAQHEGETWCTKNYKFSMIPDANVYLCIEGENYFPGRLSSYNNDAVVIPAGKTVYLNSDINDIKSIGSLHVDGELLLYANSGNKSGKQLKINGKISGKGAIRCGTSSRPYLYVSAYDEENWLFTGTNEVLDDGFPYGRIYVTGYKEDITYYFAGTKNDKWNTWENWRLDKDLKRVYAFIGGKETYPTSHYDTDIAVIGVAGATRKDVTASLADKKLNGLEVNGTLDIGTSRLELKNSFKGDGRILSTYVDGIVCVDGCVDSFYKTDEGVMFVQIDPYVFYTYNWGRTLEWGSDFTSTTKDWKIDNDYKKCNWSLVPCARVFLRTKENEYEVPSSDDEAHISCGAEINVFNDGENSRVIRQLYVENGTLVINDGKLTVSQAYRFGDTGKVKFTQPTDEWVLPTDILYEEGNEILNDGVGGTMYLTEEFAETQLSWPSSVVTFLQNRGKVLVYGVDKKRKYYLKSGDTWTSAVWTIDKTIDAAGNLVAPNYPGQSHRDDQVVILKNSDSDPSVVLNHDLNIIVSDIEVRDDASLASTFDMTIDNSLTGVGTLTAKSLTIAGKDVVKSDRTVTIDGTEKDALFVGGKVILTGSQYASGTLYAQVSPAPGTDNWSTTKWSLRSDGNVYYKSVGQTPTAFNDVVIFGDVTVDVLATVRNLTIAEGATLHVCNADLTINGELRILGDLEICESRTLIVNGKIVEIADKVDDYNNPLSRITGGGVLKPFNSNFDDENIRPKLDAFESLDEVQNNNVIYTNSTQYRTNSSGSWDGSIWEIYSKTDKKWESTVGYPAAIDEVTILHTVTVNGYYTVKDLYGSSSAILKMENLQKLNVIGENKFFEDIDNKGIGEIHITIFDENDPPIFYAQNDAQTKTNWKERKWAIDPTRKIYIYRNNKYYVPVSDVYQNQEQTKFLVNVVINEGATVNLDFSDSKTLNSLTVNGTFYVNNKKTLSVNNTINIGDNGTISIGDGSKVEAKLYVENAGTITGYGEGYGELIVSKTSRIRNSDDDKNTLDDIANNGKILVTDVDEPITYYSIKDGNWTDLSKNLYVWSIVDGKSIVNYSNHTYNDIATTSTVVINDGNTVNLTSGRSITNLIVKKGGTLNICGCRLTVINKLEVEEGGKIILCDAGTGAITTNDISGKGDIIMPRTDRLTVNGNDSFEGRIGVIGLANNLTFYFRNGDGCDCSVDNDDCNWENANNWQIDEKHEHLYAYDSSVGFYYPGQIDGHIYNVVIGSGKSVCLNPENDITVTNIKIDGKLSVGELDEGDGTVGEKHSEDSAILNVDEVTGTGVLTLEYSDNLDVKNYLLQAGTLIVNHYRKGTTYYLLESGGNWTDPFNWTTDPAASVRVNDNDSYPGKTKKNDSAVIPSGRVVTVDQTTMIDNLTVYGEVLIKDPDIYMLVSNTADGDGKMLVQDINTSFLMVDPRKNTLFRNGTITIGQSCDVPGQTFGSLIIDSNEAVRLAGLVNVTNNLEVKNGSTLILGSDINKISKNISQVRTMAREGQGLPSEYDVFHTYEVGGDVVVEENATLQAANYSSDVRTLLLTNIGGVPTWNTLKVGGSFTVNGTLNFAAPDANPSYTYHSVKDVNNRAVLKFFGSKNSEFIVNNIASVLSVVCDKDENATLYINKSESATIDMVSYFAAPDSNYTEYPLVLNSGTLRLGNQMKIKAWGASRRSNGDPVGTQQYDVYVPGSDIPVYHTEPWANYELFEAVRKSNRSEWGDKEDKNHLKKVESLGLDVDNKSEWYLNHDKQMHLFDEYKIFKNDLSQGLFIPAHATLWIDGAEVELGYGDGYTVGTNNSNVYYYGHVALQGKLKITQGGKLTLPKLSVGIVYDKPDEDVSTPASIYIEDGEIHTTRIYGLRGRKLDFNMEGGALYFDRNTNNNSDTYNTLYKRYGNGDITQGKAQGCTFSMANGGDFNMSGGLIKFYNRDAAETFTISALDLNNCGGQITGGTIAFADTADVTGGNFSVYLGNHKLHNLTVTTRYSVVFHGNRLPIAEDPTRGYAGNSLYINGNLTITKNDENRVLTPENIYVGGNMAITQYGSRMPIFSSYGDLQRATSLAPAPNLYIIGDGDSWMNVEAKNTNCVPLFNSLVINKTSSYYNFTIKGKPVYFLGNLDVKKGELVTETTRFSEYLDGIIIGNLNSLAYKSDAQSISVSADGSIANATISMCNNYPENSNVNSDLKVLNDIVVKNFYTDVNRRIFLGSNNFKVVDELKMKYRSENSMFVCTDENANGGLTLKANLNEGNTIEMPVGVTITTPTGATEYVYTRCKATAASAVEGYLTAIPCSNYHPSVVSTETATKFYWRMKWKGTEGKKILGYDFRLPGLDQQGVLAKETKTKRCGVDNCHDTSHEGELNGALPNYWLYTHYYQYYDLRWYDCGKKQIDQKYGDGFPSIPASEIISPNGDFTDGYHFDTVNGPKTYYSVASGEWNTLATWSLEENETKTPTSVPSVSDRVIIRNGHKITTKESTSGIKAAQVEFVSPGSNLSTLTVDKTTLNNSVASIVGEGKLIYDVEGVNIIGNNDASNRYDWTINARLKQTNYLMGDHSKFCDNTMSCIVFNNTTTTENEFYLPSVIRTYPNLETKGNVTIKDASAPQGITVNGDLKVTSGKLNVGCTSGRKNIVNGNVVVAKGSILNVDQNVDVYGNITNNGTLNFNNGVAEIHTDIVQSGVMSVNSTVSFVGSTQSTLKGNAVKLYDGSLIVVNKDTETRGTYFEAKLQDETTDQIVNTTFTRGKVIFNNSSTNIKVANYVNGSRSGHFDIPGTLTLDVETGTIELYGTDAQSVRLDGSLIGNNGVIKTTNGLGYSSTGTATLKLNNSAKFYASQMAPMGETGKVNFSLTSQNASVVLGSDDGIYDTRYGRLDIRGGNFNQVANSAITIKAAANGNTATVYYAPNNSNIISGSSINIDIAKTNDPEKPTTTAFVYSEKSLQGMTIGTFTDVSVMSRPLTYNSSLTINGKLITNGYDITLNGNMSIGANGQYVHGNNTTYIGGSGTQKVNGTSVEFYNLYKTGSSELQMSFVTPTVTKSMKITNGKVTMVNNPLQFAGDELFVNYDYSLVGQGVRFCGSAQQNLYCEGTISTLIVDNASGVNAATMQSHPITISSGITLTNGVLRVGANQLILQNGVKVTNGNEEVPFGLTKMISTNLALADNGVRKFVSEKETGDILLPIGYGSVYSPVTIGITSLTSSNGYFDVKPINGHYMGVNNDKKEHVLGFNWYVKPEGISNYKGKLTFVGNGVNVNGYTHPASIKDEEYIVAVYFDGKTTSDKKNANSTIDCRDAANGNITITYSFDGAPTAEKPIAGYYLAGCYLELPEYPKAYISVADGTLADDAVLWKEYDMATSSVKESEPFALTSEKIYGSHIIIDSEVTIADNGLRLSSVKITEKGKLNMGTTRAHYFGVVSGSGTLVMESGNMPSANYDSFLDKNSGGTLEFAGSTDYNILYSFTQVKNLVLSGSGTRTFMDARNVKLDIFGDYIVDGPIAKSDADIRLHGEMEVKSGTFAGTGTYVFCGSAKQTLKVAGSALTLSGIEIDNAKGVDVVNGQGPSEDVDFRLTKRLVLTTGVLKSPKVTITDYNATHSGNKSSYVDGWLYRQMNTGNRYEYYVGDGTRYGHSALQVTSSGMWGVKFHNSSVIDEENSIFAVKSNGVHLSLGSEYWEVTRSGASGTTYPTISWDDKSNYNGTQTTYQSYYSTDMAVGQNTSIWAEATTTANSGSSTAGEVTLKNGTNGFNPGSGSVFFALGKKPVDVSMWLGKSDDWFNRNNWEGGLLPNTSKEVYISNTDGSIINPVIRENSLTAEANTIWLNGSETHLTIEAGGKLINNGSIVVSDAENSHITIRHRYNKTATVKLNDGFFETVAADKRSKDNRYNKVRVEYTLQSGRYIYFGSATKEGEIESDPKTLFLALDMGSYSFVKPAETKFDSDYGQGAAIGQAGSTEWTMNQVGTVMASGNKEWTIKDYKWSDGVYKWALLSNPFTFSFPLTETAALSYSSNVDPVVWFRSFDQTNRQYYFSTYNIVTRVGVANGEYSVAENTPMLAPQQSFYVRLLSGTEGTIKFDADKVSDATRNTSLKRLDVPANDVLRLVVSSVGQNSDEMAMVFRAGGSMEQVYGDAEKWGLADYQNQISSIKDGAKMVIPFYPSADELVEEVIPLSVYLSKNSTEGMITSTNLDDFDDEYDVFLHDFAKDVVVNLRDEGSYSFKREDGDVLARFGVSLKYVKSGSDDPEEPNVPTDIVEYHGAQIMLYKESDGKAVAVVSESLIGDNSVVNVYDMLGRLVNTVDIKSVSTRIDLGEQKGVYVVEVIAGDMTKTLKMLK